MKNEKAFWRKVQGIFTEEGARLRRMSDDIQSGVPDGCYIAWGISGLLEFKYTRHWPKRATTRVKVGHGLTTNQREYLEDWRAHGGNAYVLLGIEDAWYLLLPQDIPYSNRVTREHLQHVAVLQGVGNMSLTALPKALADLGRIRYTSVSKSAA